MVGTQLVTKGYHFPNLTLVGVVDADLGLSGGDLRAAERSFQQIQQVAGRAGRGDKPGRVLVQTHDPDAPVIAALVTGDAAGFYAAETDARREAAMPPFGRLAAIIVSSEDASEAEGVARRIGHAAPEVEGMAVFGPAPAPLAMLRGRHRQRLLVHASRSLDVQDVIRDWLAGVEWSSKVRVSVDVDLTASSKLRPAPRLPPTRAQSCAAPTMAASARPPDRAHQDPEPGQGSDDDRDDRRLEPEAVTRQQRRTDELCIDQAIERSFRKPGCRRPRPA